MSIMEKEKKKRNLHQGISHGFLHVFAQMNWGHVLKEFIISWLNVVPSHCAPQPLVLNFQVTEWRWENKYSTEPMPGEELLSQVSFHQQFKTFKE